MDREKVLELAREVFSKPPMYIGSEKLCEFAALIEAEVRGGATSGAIHSCSYYCTRPACIRAQRDELRDKMESAPAVVRQLVEALEELLAESEQGYAICPLTIKQAKAALAAVKGAK